MGLKLHEDWGTTPAAIDNCLTVAEQYDIQVARLFFYFFSLLQGEIEVIFVLAINSAKFDRLISTLTR